MYTEYFIDSEGEVGTIDVVDPGPISIIGTGARRGIVNGNIKIRFNSNPAWGIVPPHTVKIKNIEVKGNIDIEYTHLPSCHFNMVTIEDTEVRNTQPLTSCIRMKSCWLSQVERCVLRGHHYHDLSNIHQLLNGNDRVNSGVDVIECVRVDIDKCDMQSVRQAVKISGHNEAIHIRSCESTLVLRHLLSNGRFNTGISTAKPIDIVVEHCHSSAFEFGVDLRYSSQCRIIGNNFYYGTDSTAGRWNGVELVDGTDHSVVSFNHFIDTNGNGPRNGVFNGAPNNIIIGNTGHGMDTTVISSTSLTGGHHQMAYNIKTDSGLSQTAI